MCGIVGYIGNNFAEIVVADGLTRLDVDQPRNLAKRVTVE